MRSKEAEILTEIVLCIFRVNGCLLQSGDHLVQPLDLTSARWQIMGAVALAGKPLTTPQIGAAMGITRQGVQKQVNALVKEGLMALHPNPGHKRSPFVALTETGEQIYKKVDTLQADWANQLAEGITSNDLQVTLRTIERVHERLLKNING